MKNLIKYIFIFLLIISSSLLFGMKSKQSVRFAVEKLRSGIQVFEKKKEDDKFKCIQTSLSEQHFHKGFETSFGFHKKRGLFASISFKTICVWQNINGQFECIQTIDEKSGGHTDYVRTIAFSKDGLLASASGDRTIKIWQMQDNGQFKCIQTLDEKLGGHTHDVLSVVFNKDNLLVSSSSDRTIKIWQMQNNAQFKCIQTLDKKLSGEEMISWSIVFHKRDLFASCGGGGFWISAIKIWQMQDNGQFKCIQTLDKKLHDKKLCGEEIIWSVAFHKSGLLVSGSGDYLHGTIKIWQMQDNGQFKCIQTIETDGCVKSVVFLDLDGDEKERVGYLTNNFGTEILPSFKIKILDFFNEKETKLNLARSLLF